jgi:hypothetical protein
MIDIKEKPYGFSRVKEKPISRLTGKNPLGFLLT